MNKQNWIYVSIFNFIVCEYKYFNKFCIKLWRIFFFNEDGNGSW